MITSKTMLVTPKLAAEWLKTSKGNPRWKNKTVDPQRVALLVDDITNNRWNPGGGTIAFDDDGHLVDGHHRLSAVVKAGKPILVVVIFGVKNDGLMHIDDNMPRSNAMLLHISNRDAAVAKLHALRIDTKSVKGTRKISVEIMKRVIDTCPNIHKAVTISSQGMSHTSGSPCQTAGAMHGVFCALEYGVDENIIGAFVRAANTGFYDGKGQTSAWAFAKTAVYAKKAYNYANAKNVFLSNAMQAAICDWYNKNPRFQNYSRISTGMYFDKLVALGHPGFTKESILDTPLEDSAL